MCLDFGLLTQAAKVLEPPQPPRLLNLTTSLFCLSSLIYEKLTENCLLVPLSWPLLVKFLF